MKNKISEQQKNEIKRKRKEKMSKQRWEWLKFNLGHPKVDKNGIIRIYKELSDNTKKWRKLIKKSLPNPFK